MGFGFEVVRTALAGFAVSALAGELQLPVVGPEFDASIDGRSFEPATAFASIERSPSGDTLRVYIDEVASSCDELAEVRGRRIVIGPFVYRAGRTMSAAQAGAVHVRLDPEDIVRTGRFVGGRVALRVVDRDAPSIPFEVEVDLDDRAASHSYARGDVFVTPCVLAIR